ncbi:putative NAD-dependent epimerase/dehydratase family protein [Gordonia araii NBRC 100433]|uniref:Putative NAD-dependent epimerase/dehydratase family protein n=1 Tax=Gordonia araii NBRC 100433 TaxID=1073574 RepID=G7H0Q2_9ACTN|nr:NAD-dependent epimerase/dehydratase family protein [Gordonia araii]NNG96810.1 NAD-dependent epimerase/dehydratase family protein [Gordonia araii NBRC 100433]GAB09427.1 putative NAD-dependent epimerase/dehydratase family protein [Gordonia araii NBRC 100433]
MRVAVTGAAGFVGTNLIDRLVADGHEVLAIDRAVPAESTHPVERCTWREIDIFDVPSLTEALTGVDRVFHLVAMITLKQEDPVAWRVNTEGVGAVARAALAAGVGRFVHCSSIHSFDQYATSGVLDESSSRAADPGIPVYDRSKWAGEQELRAVVADGLDAVIANPTGVYGPADGIGGRPLSRINGMLRDAARGVVPVFIEGGFDLVDVRDVAAGLALAAEHGRTGENYILGGEQVRLMDAMRSAAKLTGRMQPAFAIPNGLLKAVIAAAEPLGHLFGSDLVSRASISAIQAAPSVDCTKARAELGYAPRPSSQTVSDLVSFLADHDRLGRARPVSELRYQPVVATTASGPA